MRLWGCFFFFFFQAEDGIRDADVTGVQTCALPISFFEAGAMDVASVDVIWNGFHQAKKIADLAETFEVNCAPHNYYSHLATFISAQWCAAIPNVRILEVDVDDVPWREQLTSAVPELDGGRLRIPAGPGWGADVNEDVLREHAWPT